MQSCLSFEVEFMNSILNESSKSTLSSVVVVTYSKRFSNYKRPGVYRRQKRFNFYNFLILERPCLTPTVLFLNDALNASMLFGCSLEA